MAKACSLSFQMSQSGWRVRGCCIARIDIAVHRMQPENYDPSDEPEALQMEHQMERLALKLEGLILMRRVFMALTAALVTPFPWE